MVVQEATMGRPVQQTSTEAEYRSLAITTTELIWIESLLKELVCLLPHQSSTVTTDNLIIVALLTMFYILAPSIWS